MKHKLPKFLATLRLITRTKMSCTNNEHESVTLFREYLRIPSVHPEVNYGNLSLVLFCLHVLLSRYIVRSQTYALLFSDGCVKFLTAVANDLKLPIKVIETVPRNPVVIITVVGLHPELPSILLNSHMDVVPVFSVSMQYLRIY